MRLGMGQLGCGIECGHHNRRKPDRLDAPYSVTKFPKKFGDSRTSVASAARLISPSSSAFPTSSTSCEAISQLMFQ